MKFQNPSFNFFERTNKRTHGQTDGQAESNMLPNFFKVGGITILYKVDSPKQFFLLPFL